jgi:hypothetical protein
MIKISVSKLLPLLSQLGKYFKVGLDHYAMLRERGDEVGPEVIAAYIETKMDGWDPKISGTPVLDDETKAAAARMLAGVTINLAKA